MKKLLILALALSFTSCMNGGDSAADLTPGQLQLVSMKGLAKVATSSPTSGSSSYEFDLDTANSSLQHYFLLQNTGDCDVKSVKLTTNNPHFTFSPSEIELVPPSSGSELMQLIKLSVVHGVKLNGVGPDSLLPMGNNLATIQLTGNTANAHGDSIRISQSVQFKVFAKVFDLVVLRQDSIPINFSKYGLGYNSAFFGYTHEAIRTYDSGIDTLTVVNAGNAPFHILIFNSRYVPVDSFEVAGGASFKLLPSTIQVDGHGVVSDPSKQYLYTHPDGKVYMGL